MSEPITAGRSLTGPEMLETRPVDPFEPALIVSVYLGSPRDWSPLGGTEVKHHVLKVHVSFLAFDGLRKDSPTPESHRLVDLAGPGVCYEDLKLDDFELAPAPLYGVLEKGSANPVPSPRSTYKEPQDSSVLALSVRSSVDRAEPRGSPIYLRYHGHAGPLLYPPEHAREPLSLRTQTGSIREERDSHVRVFSDLVVEGVVVLDQRFEILPLKVPYLHDRARVF